jgi:hypothetical protein
MLMTTAPATPSTVDGAPLAPPPVPAARLAKARALGLRPTSGDRRRCEPSARSALAPSARPAPAPAVLPAPATPVAPLAPGDRATLRGCEVVGGPAGTWVPISDLATVPTEMLREADAVAPGEVLLLTTDVTDADGTLIYRVSDRFIRGIDGGLHSVANVGEGAAATVVLQTSRVWAA